MKRVIILAIAAVSLTACRNDEKQTQQNSIVGVWKPTKDVIYDGKTKSILKEVKVDDCKAKSTYEFTQNLEAILHKFDKQTSSTTINGVKTTTTECIDYGIRKLSYKYDTSTKKISLTDGKTEIYDVFNLTSSELQLIVNEEDQNNDGVKDLTVSILTKVK